MAEQRTFNPLVQGSTPWRPTQLDQAFHRLTDCLPWPQLQSWLQFGHVRPQQAAGHTLGPGASRWQDSSVSGTATSLHEQAHNGLNFHRMDPQVVAAWIAADDSMLTLIGTLAVQYLSYRAASRDAEQTAEEQRRQLDRTLAEQRDQLDRTLAGQNQQLDRALAEQRTRTLNEGFATAADQLGSDKPAVQLAGVYAMAGLAADWEETSRPASMCYAPTCGCHTSPIRARTLPRRSG